MGGFMIFSQGFSVLLIGLGLIAIAFLTVTLVIAVIFFVKAKRKPKGEERDKFTAYAILFALPVIVSVATYIFGFITDAVDTAVTGHEHRLSDAVCKLDAEKVQKYLNKGDDPNKFDKSCYIYPLRQAFRNTDDSQTVKGKEARLQILELLLENGADPDIPRTPDKTAERTDWTQLQSLCMRHNHFDFTYRAMELLLKYGADPNKEYSGTDWKSPLSAICGNQKDGDNAIKMAELLLEYGADINKTGIDGKTALDYAKEYNKKELAEFLEASDKA